jgi:ferredoxin
VLEWVRFPRAAQRATRVSPRWRSAKYWLLVLLLASALFGSLTLFVLDPITLLTRTMTTVVLPALNHGVTAVERVLYSIGFLRPLVDGVERLLRGPALPVVQPVFGYSVLIALLFAGVVALNSLADRFWCRYLCPLGGLLGLISKVSLFRPVVGRACNRCAQCVGVCRLDAIESSRDYEIVSSECTVCLDCQASCPQSAAGIQLRPRSDRMRAYDPGRREVLAGIATAAAGVAIMRTAARAKQPDPYLIRPPGTGDEGEFLSRCVRCSQCMKVCPTSGLQPALFEAGVEGLWTPRLEPRLGYCEYGCNACGQVCPSGAIPPLDLALKQQQVIGFAVVDRNRCIAWADETPCIVCEEMCPVPEKAIRLDAGAQGRGHGQGLGGGVQKPVVLPALCIGCGICEYQCPVEGESAIRVYRGWVSS